MIHIVHEGVANVYVPGTVFLNALLRCCGQVRCSILFCTILEFCFNVGAGTVVVR